MSGCRIAPSCWKRTRSSGWRSSSVCWWHGIASCDLLPTEERKGRFRAASCLVQFSRRHGQHAPLPLRFQLIPVDHQRFPINGFRIEVDIERIGQAEASIAYVANVFAGGFGDELVKGRLKPATSSAVKGGSGNIISTFQFTFC